jgi:hypothetical protein
METKKYVIQDEPEYEARMDSYAINGVYVNMMHLDFKIWSPKAFKKLLHAWKHFRFFIKGPLYAINNDVDDYKWEKFVTRLGFTYFMHVDCPDGINRRCFISQDNADG